MALGVFHPLPISPPWLFFLCPFFPEATGVLAMEEEEEEEEEEDPILPTARVETAEVLDGAARSLRHSCSTCANCADAFKLAPEPPADPPLAPPPDEGGRGRTAELLDSRSFFVLCLPLPPCSWEWLEALFAGCRLPFVSCPLGPPSLASSTLRRLSASTILSCSCANSFLVSRSMDMPFK